MKPAFVDKVKPEEVQHAQDAFNRVSDKNLLDPGVFAYPATVILKAYILSKNVVYLAIQNCCMLDSMGIPHDATAAEVAAGLRSLIVATVYEAKQRGHGEIYFPCKDEQTASFAEHHGFEKFDVPMYRLKI